MTASQKARSKGLDSLAQITRITGVSKETLTNWHKNKESLFNIVIIGCLEDIRQRKIDRFSM
jgi:AcrR family transcriptional regulator